MKPSRHPQVWIALLVIVGVTLLCKLGFWQLRRAAEKQNYLDQLAQAQILSPLSNQELLAQIHAKSLTPLRFLPVRLKGTFDNYHTILLDNKIHQHQVGYHVITPMHINEEWVVLINRGWIPLGTSRQRLPQIPTITGEVTIEGYLDFAYRNRFISNSQLNLKVWPLRMQQLDNDFLQSTLGIVIYPMLVNLRTDSPYAFTEVTPAPVMSPARHRGYAIQWFALAFTLGLFALYLLLSRSNHE